ncbi:hypothetical protein O0L34_g19529 [Tuta absoluta]|nr:hypothetical protein O0L34_g19529 [Tuta absoluta]
MVPTEVASESKPNDNPGKSLTAKVTPKLTAPMGRKADEHANAPQIKKFTGGGRRDLFTDTRTESQRSSAEKKNVNNTLLGESASTARDNPLLMPNTGTNSQSDENDKQNQPWQLVGDRKKHRRHQKRRVVITGNGSTDDQLLTVERARKIHVCFLKNHTTADAVIAFMNKKNPSTNYFAQKLQLKHEHYSSFAVTVPASKYEYFMSADVWPPSIEVSEWFRFNGGRANGAPPRPPSTAHYSGTPKRRSNRSVERQ